MTFSGLRYHKKQWKKYYNYNDIRFNLYDVIMQYQALNNGSYFQLLLYDKPEKDFTIINRYFDSQNKILYVELAMDIR